MRGSAEDARGAPLVHRARAHSHFIHPCRPRPTPREQRYTKPTQARQQRDRNATYMSAKTERVKLMEEMTLQSALWPW